MWHSMAILARDKLPEDSRRLPGVIRKLPCGVRRFKTIARRQKKIQENCQMANAAKGHINIMWTRQNLKASSG